MMDVQYINPFVKSVASVFETMAKFGVTMGAPYLKDPKKSLQHVFCVAVAINLSGPTSGTVVMRFSKPVVLAVVRSMTGDEPDWINADCLDAMGEMANMVVGNAKRLFPVGGTLMSLPNVSKTDPLTAPPVLVLPFDCGAGRFLIEARLFTTPAGDQGAAPQPAAAA